ncbi:MAG: nitrate- and nitrite sensing domain-containing protein [Nocardiopsaceae bacterium]|nr:nitrate- and nitrite sensing domain-containing protein [Nocardiopsaceae bacterium]
MTAEVRQIMAPAASSGSGRSNRRLMRNWRVRSRLVLLIAIPTATAVALGASSIVSSWKTAVDYQRVAQLATLSAKVTKLAYQLEYERDNTVWYIAMKTGPDGVVDKTLSDAATSQLQVVKQQYVYTNKAEGPVREGASEIGPTFPPGVVIDAHSVLSELDFIKSVRTAALASQASATDVITRYSNVIDVLLAFEGQIALTSNDPSLTSTVSALSQISRIQQEFSIQRGLIVYSLTADHFAPNMFQMLNNSVANQSSDSAQFTNFASAQQENLYNVALENGSLKDRVRAAESSVIKYQPGHKTLSGLGIPSEEWFGNITETIGKVRQVEEILVSDAINRAQDLRKQAIISASAIGGAVLIVLVIALLFTVIVGRSMVRPLRRLRAGALEVAGVGLPETVRRMSEADSDNISIDVQPIDVDSFDEIGEVARAFDQVHREALRLAANEAALRGNVNAMFVNLSRRSQSLVERQIKLIDELEQGEQDAERLGSLFQMDHLATRMRRNSENLLVLAGHESARRWNQPVPLVDVLRAAVSEIEQYERVTLNVQPGIAVRGPAVNDVVHLIAELAENATSFSSADTPVNVSGHLLNSGGVLLDITDLGVGMGSEEMAHANWRLDNPPVVDVAVSRRMGLFVVARLAARHGIRVRLRPATGAGLTALVWLPDEVVVRESAGSPSGAGRFQEPFARFSIGTGRAGIAGAASPGELAAADGPHALAAGASTAEQEVAAARTPRFSPPDQNGPGEALGPQRVPGIGPHPGRFATPSGSIPGAVDPAAAAESEPPGSVTGPVFGAEHPSIPGAAASNEWPEPGAAGTIELPIQPAAAGTEQAAEAGPRPPGEMPAGGQPAAWSDTGTQPVPAWSDSHNGSTNGGVIIPPAASLAEENRLPIFEAVESDWFRRGRPAVDVSGSARGSWTSPADEGWKVAEAAVAPSSSGTTVAGLPRRVPRANLIPGTATESTTPAPVRSAAATRERFASLQRGVREARAASGTDNDDGTTDVPGDG